MVFFYEKKLPNVNDLVVCQFETTVTDAGYIVILLEYDNKKGFISIKELTQAKRYRSIKNLADIGDIEVLEVISIHDNDDIDLTRRHIDPFMKENVFSKYKIWKRVYDYLDSMVSIDDQLEFTEKILHPFISEVTPDVKNGSYSGSEEDNDANENSHEKSICMQISSTSRRRSELDHQRDPSGGNSTSTCSSMRETISFSTWSKHQQIEFTTTSCQIVYNHVVKLLDRPVDKEIQKKIINIPSLSKLRIYDLNCTLRYIEEQFNVFLKTQSAKTCNYLVISRNKIFKNEFDCLLENISKFDNLQTQQNFENNTYLKESSRELDSSTSAEAGTQKNNVQPILNIGIVGHVAHGKTTLIEAITGVDTRTHKKEVASNRTLNIGYTNAQITKCLCNGNDEYKSDTANNNCQDCCSCPFVKVSIVDCPGHHVLLSTMITGASVMDTCMLVVSADEDCPQPQTAEHVAVMEMIGKKCFQPIIIQNKVDLVESNVAKNNYTQIRSFTDDTMFEKSPVIPISAQIRVNIHHVLKYIYEQAFAETIRRSNEKEDEKEDENEAKGIIIRTFDINKPGSSTVCGAVIGGSILNGEFSLNEEIMIVPLCISAKIISMKSDTLTLETARSGGLIAIQTDINPSYCDNLVGSAFIKRKYYKEEHLITSDKQVTIKYRLLITAKSIRFQPEERLCINYLGNTSEMKITYASHSKNRLKGNLSKSIYIFPESEKDFFTIVYKKRLIGVGLFVFASHSKKIANEDEHTVLDISSFYASYDEMYAEFSNNLTIWKDMSIVKTRLPVPKCIYKNTFTTVYNFGEICDLINIKTDILGEYIRSELGCKSYSVNSNRCLILKGRTDERKMMIVLQNFISERRCIMCKQNTIIIVKNHGVKQKQCKNCSWKGI